MAKNQVWGFADPKSEPKIWKNLKNSSQRPKKDHFEASNDQNISQMVPGGILGRSDDNIVYGITDPKPWKADFRDLQVKTDVKTCQESKF